MKNNKGFTIIETLIAIVIFTLLMGVFLNWLQERNNLLTSKSLADQTNGYANVFISYLNNNKSSLKKTITPGNPLAVSWSDLQSQGYVPTGTTDKNLYGQTPCLVILQNSTSNVIYPILTFVNGNKIPTDSISAKAIAYLGGVSGIYQNIPDTVFGEFGLWKYTAFKGTYTNLFNHCGGFPPDNSIVMNIGMMNQFNDAITPYAAIQRTQDLNSNIGESGNRNTVSTDLTLANNSTGTSSKLLFNNSNSVYWNQISGSNVTLNNAGVTAQVIQPIQQMNPGTICTAAQIGSVAASINAQYGMQSSVLVCSYNPPVCQAQANSDYCYTAIKHNTIKYNNTGYMGSTFMCPAGAPAVSDAQATNVVVSFGFQNCTQVNQITYQCSNPIQYFNKSYTSSGQPVLAPITVDNVNYYMQVGYKAVARSPTPSSCTDICSAMGRSFKPSTAFPMINNVTGGCACQSGSFRGTTYSLVNVVSTKPTQLGINYVTCTTKLILTQQ